MRTLDADGLPMRPRWLRRPLLFAALALVALGLALAGFGAKSLRALRENARHPWIADCMGRAPAPGDSSFFLPPIHSADRRWCLSAPAQESLAKDAPEEGRAFADRRDLTRIEVWDAREARYRLLIGHRGRVRCYALAAPLLLTASDDPADPAARLWSLETGALLRTFDAGRPACWGGFAFMGFSPDRAWAVTATDDRAVRIWDVATGRALGALPVADGVTVFAFSPDGALLALGEFTGDLSLWDWRAGRRLRSWHAHDPTGAGPDVAGGVERLRFSPDGLRLESAGPLQGRPAERSWDAATGRPLPR